MVQRVRSLLSASLAVGIVPVGPHSSERGELEAKYEDVSRVWEGFVKRGVRTSCWGKEH